MALSTVLTTLEANKGDADTVPGLTRTYVTIASRLAPKDAPKALSTLLATLEANKGDDDDYTVPALAEAYAAVASRLDTKDAPEALSTVLAMLEANKGDDNTVRRLAEAYVTVAERLDAKDARTRARAARLLRDCDDIDFWQILATAITGTGGGWSLEQHVAVVIEMLKPPISSSADSEPLLRGLANRADRPSGMPTQQASSPRIGYNPRHRRAVPRAVDEADLWAFVDWVTETYPDIHLAGAPDASGVIARIHP